MQQYSIIIICIMALVIIGIVVAIVLINKNKNKNTSIITTLNPTNDLTNIEKSELLFDENIPSINLSRMLPVVLDKRPDSSKLMKIDDKNVIAEIDNFAANAAKTANSANAFNQISNLANNVAKVDIPMDKLYHISGDKVRFFVQENGKMAQNAIGTPVDLSGVQAANIVNAGMGIASMAVGQYYLKTISDKMDTLNDSVNKISSFNYENFESKIINIISSIQEIAKFKYEILSVEEIRNNKIKELVDIKKDCKILLGQANRHISNELSSCKDYKQYESKTRDLDQWFAYQQILSLALQEISKLEYALYLGKMSRELSINSYYEYVEGSKITNEKVVEWHQSQQNILDIKIDKGLKRRDGVKWFLKLIKKEYKKIDNNIISIIEKQMNNDVPTDNDKVDRFKSNVSIIKDGNDYYYLIEDKSEDIENKQNEDEKE